MIKREIEKVCKQLFTQFPILSITGPRQSGKTTLARNLFPDKPYINFEFPDERRLAIEDPRAFLNRYPEGAVLDEIQRVPEIPSYLQGIVDEKKTTGLYVLTGSQQFEISQTISQSLAGRAAMIKLLPLSIDELSGYRTPRSLDDLMLNGFYPGLHVSAIDPRHYYSSYLETYIERDLRQLTQIDNLGLFEKFMRLLAAGTSSLRNANSLANDCGISVPTAGRWISILEASYIVLQLPPFFRNIGKRLIKSPKLYFFDTGLLCFLLGIETKAHLQSHPHRGAIFENMIVMELLKKRFNQGLHSNLYFYRDKTGNEVDVVSDRGTKIVPIEIKSSQTPHADFCKGLKVLRAVLPDEVSDGYVVYDGDSEPTVDSFRYLNWRNLRLIDRQGSV
jgi:uncharacterized protein